jgi:ribonuclease Z
MAGTFANQVDAQDLVLNHIGGRFPAPRNPQDHARHKIINDIGKKASQAWGKGSHVTVAHDFLRVHLPFNPTLDSNHAVLVPEIEASTSGGLARSREDSELPDNRKRRR